MTVGCPLLIADGLKGTDDVSVPVPGGEYVKEARIGRAVMDADVFISLTHFFEFLREPHTKGDRAKIGEIYLCFFHPIHLQSK